MSEADVKADLKPLICVDHKAWFYMIVPNGYSRKGPPDFIGCLPVLITPSMVGSVRGMFFAVETKTKDTMQPDPWQEREMFTGVHLKGMDMPSIIQAGGRAIVAGAPSHMDAVERLFWEMRS